MSHRFARQLSQNKVKKKLHLSHRNYSWTPRRSYKNNANTNADLVEQHSDVAVGLHRVNPVDWQAQQGRRINNTKRTAEKSRGAAALPFANSSSASSTCTALSFVAQWRFYVAAGAKIAPLVSGFASAVLHDATKIVTVNNRPIKGRYSPSWEPHLRATGHHLPYEITCHPTQVNAPRLTPAMHTGTRFTYLGGMEGWVDLLTW